MSLRTVEREVAHLRRELEAEALATVRFETPPGKQLQIHFGETRVPVALVIALAGMLAQASSNVPSTEK